MEEIGILKDYKDLNEELFVVKCKLVELYEKALAIEDEYGKDADSSDQIFNVIVRVNATRSSLGKKIRALEPLEED